MDSNEHEKTNDIGLLLVEKLRPLYEVSNYIGSLIKKSTEWYEAFFKTQDYGREIQEKLNTFAAVASATVRSLLLADNLGKHQYVIWEYMTPEFVDTFLSLQI